MLDLWGLGSETVRQAREGDRANPGWIGQLVEARRIGLAMLYAGDFIAKIPPNWRSIAVLRAPHYIVDSDTVTFYATTPAAVRDILASLKAFSDDAGPEAQITVLEGAETPTISAPSVVRRGDHP